MSDPDATTVAARVRIPAALTGEVKPLPKSAVRTRNGAFNRWYCTEFRAPSFVNMFREAFEAGQRKARADERQRIRQLAIDTAAKWRAENRCDPDGGWQLIDADALDRFADLLAGDGDE